MRKSVTELSVLIASPGDVDETRQAVRDAVYTWNETHSVSRNVTLAPRMWETHATPVLGDRPQSIINRQVVAGCDIAIALFWHRLGTPTGEAPSGTAEEIQQLINLGKKVSVYFCEAPYPTDVDTSQLEGLRA
jgi:hypothetical protein